MEYVFEDFIFGFIDSEIDKVTAKSQRSDKYLDEEQTFKLKPDLWLKTEHNSLIADTKYKIVYSDDKDPKKGISQNDLYQMLAYAVRFEVDEIILFYPNTVSQNQEEESDLTIKDALANEKEISVKAVQLPIINRQLLDHDFDAKLSLRDLFVSTRIGLIERLEKLLN